LITKAITDILLDHRFCKIAAVSWMAVIFFLSSLPDIPGPELFPAQDKLAHFLISGILAVFVTGALGPWKEGITWRWVAIVALIVSLYGGLDEIHQMFVPGRDASTLDLLFDSLGGLCFAYLYRY